MGKNNETISERELPSFYIIKAASEGDVVAINEVLKHYEGYIAALSIRTATLLCG